MPLTDEERRKRQREYQRKLVANRTPEERELALEKKRRYQLEYGARNREKGRLAAKNYRESQEGRAKRREAAQLRRKNLSPVVKRELRRRARLHAMLKKDGADRDDLFRDILAMVPKTRPADERYDIAVEVALLYFHGSITKAGWKAAVAGATKSANKKFGLSFDFSLDAEKYDDGGTTYLDLLAAPEPDENEDEMEADTWATVRLARLAKRKPPAR